MQDELSASLYIFVTWFVKGSGLAAGMVMTSWLLIGVIPSLLGWVERRFKAPGGTGQQPSGAP